MCSSAIRCCAAAASAPRARGCAKARCCRVPTRGASGSCRATCSRHAFGGASGYVQFVSHGGAIVVPGGQGATPKIAPDARDLAIAASGSGRQFSDRTVKGTHLRVLTVGIDAPSSSAPGATGSTRASGAAATPGGAAQSGGTPVGGAAVRREP